MSVMIDRGNELLRISQKDSKKLECSRNGGISWIVRYSGSSSVGEFSDLMDRGEEILATTSKGVFYSKNGGISWIKRN